MEKIIMLVASKIACNFFSVCLYHTVLKITYMLTSINILNYYRQVV